MSRICIIGDVHGMTELLQALLAQLDLQPGDTLVSLGDLVDKGPDPAGTVRALSKLQREAPFEVVLVEANHEDRHLRYQRNLTERPKIARQMANASARLPELDAVLTDDDREFLQSAVLFWRLPRHGIICLHGGIPANMNALPDEPTAIHEMSKKDQNWYRQILRTRFIDAETGKMLSLGREKEGDPFWAEVYDGRFGHVIFGHQPFFDGPAEFPHATGIDTGAVDGGALTALVIQSDGSRTYVSEAADSAGQAMRGAIAPLR